MVFEPPPKRPAVLPNKPAPPEDDEGFEVPPNMLPAGLLDVPEPKMLPSLDVNMKPMNKKSWLNALPDRPALFPALPDPNAPPPKFAVALEDDMSTGRRW
jgi:hypothetical protein